MTAGERAEIKVDTFNFTRYGLLGGTVMSIAQDAINRANSGNGKDDPDPIAKRELVYAARVALDRADMLIDGKTIKLSPGMAVTVEIKTGSRHVIEYLLSPLMRYRQQALRER